MLNAETKERHIARALNGHTGQCDDEGEDTK